jgi:hypothetical protein
MKRVEQAVGVNTKHLPRIRQFHPENQFFQEGENRAVKLSPKAHEC